MVTMIAAGEERMAKKAKAKGMLIPEAFRQAPSVQGGRSGIHVLSRVLLKVDEGPVAANEHGIAI